jgi:hypothetical protein
MVFILEEELIDCLPDSFLGKPYCEPWQENTIVGIWFVLLIGYILSMAPIIFISLFFWFLAVEWSLESSLHFSYGDTEYFDDESEYYEQEQCDIGHHTKKELFALMDHFGEASTTSSDSEKLGLLEGLHLNFGVLRFSVESFEEEEDEKRSDMLDPKREKGLDASHFHYHEVPHLVKAEWN